MVSHHAHCRSVYKYIVQCIIHSRYPVGTMSGTCGITADTQISDLAPLGTMVSTRGIMAGCRVSGIITGCVVSSIMVGYEVSSTTRLFLSSSPFPSARSLFPTTVAARNQCHSLHRQALVQDVWGAIPRRILEEEGTAAPASCSGAPPTRCCVRRHARPRRVRLGKATRNRVDSR